VITLMTRFGMNVVLAHPEGYDLVPETLAIAGRHAQESGGSFRRAATMAEAFAGADIVYPKSWAPYDVMVQRTELLRVRDAAGLGALEKQCLARNAGHADWQCDRALMDLTQGGEARYLHCLPADITGVSCPRGEVSAEVFAQHRDPLYRQAGYKPYVIAAMMLCGRFADPAGVLRDVAQRGTPRR
jgi:ornithine carbamoyltransferase